MRLIRDLIHTEYGYGQGDSREDHEPGVEDVQEAWDRGLFESRSFQDPEVLSVLKGGGIQRAVEYHAQRIAFLVKHGWDDPIQIDQNGFVLDGNHRLRAAAFRGDAEIEVIVVD